MLLLRSNFNRKATPPKVSPKRKKVLCTNQQLSHNPKDEDVEDDDDDEEFLPDEVEEEDDAQNTIQELLKSVLSDQKNREIPGMPIH